MLETLLRERLDDLPRKAGELEISGSPDEALVSWFREGVTFVHSSSGLVDFMAAALADPDSALQDSCITMRSAGRQLLLRTQKEGSARTDIDGADLFALIATVGWLGNQQGIQFENTFMPWMKYSENEGKHRTFVGNISKNATKN